MNNEKVQNRKEIDVPSGFYCMNCQYLMSEKNLQNKTVFYCYLSRLWKRPNSKGKFIKDDICVANCLETLNRS